MRSFKDDHVLLLLGERHQRGRRAFTLIELLIVIAIIGVVMAILIPALSKARRCVFRSRELSAAGQLMAAYALYADDNRSNLLPGYVPVGMVTPSLPGAQIEVYDESGERLSGVRAQRYPWRIAPYLEYNFAGLYKDDALLARYRDRSDYQYIISLSPSFGLNSDFVGGKATPGFGFNQAAWNMWGAFYVKRMDQPIAPERLVVFTSARGVDPDGGDPAPGYYEISSPNLLSRRWGAPGPFHADDPPETTGNVDGRHDGKAVVTTFDGHAETLTLIELDDMRRWSNQATSADWVLGQR